MATGYATIGTLRALKMLIGLSVLVHARIGDISKNIVDHDADFADLDVTSAFAFHPTIAGSANTTHQKTGGYLEGGTILDRRQPPKKSAGMATELETPQEYIRYSIPQENGEDMVLRLFRTKVYSVGAQVCAGEDKNNCKNPEQGQHYWGIVEDHPDDSLASCSISDYEVECLIQLGDHTFELGNLKGTNSEVFYETKQLKASPASTAAFEDQLDVTKTNRAKSVN